MNKVVCLIFSTVLPLNIWAQSIIVEKADGPITSNELNAFKEYINFANTYIDVILAITQPNGKYAGMVDGTSRTGNSGGYNFVRDEYFYLADFKRDQFERMIEINRKADKIADFLPATARLLWQKKEDTWLLKVKTKYYQL